MPGLGITDFDVTLDAVNALGVIVVAIVTQFIGHPHADEQGPGHTQRQSNDVDQTGSPIFEESARGNAQEEFEHGSQVVGATLRGRPFLEIPVGAPLAGAPSIRAAPAGIACKGDHKGSPQQGSPQQGSPQQGMPLRFTHENSPSPPCHQTS